MSETTTRFFVPFAKVQKLADGRVLVEGTATSETVDAGGDVITYEASKRAFAAWPGNVREMHQPKAVGRAAEWIPDDTRNAIILRAHISKGAPDTQEKILDGTLAGYSVLARPTERPTYKLVDGKKVRVISGYDLLEVSVVDRGMNPDTNDLAVIAKADGFTGLVEGGVMEKPEEKKAETEEVAAEEKKADDAVEAKPEDEEKPSDEKKKPVAKHYSYAEPESDLECAIYCLRGLKSLRMGELAETEQEPAQVALLDTAIEALKRFIGEEAMELAEVEMQVTEAPKSLRVLPVMRAALAKVAALSTDSAEIRKAVGAIPAPQTFDIEPLQRAVGDQAQATQKALGELATGLKAVGDGVAKILAAPVPGGPVRMAAFPKGHVIQDEPRPALGVIDDLIAKASGDPMLAGWLRVQKAREEARQNIDFPRP